MTFMKFHFVAAASSVSIGSIPIRLKSMAHSLTSAMLASRCTFSSILAASATRIDGARWTPASTTCP